MSWQQWVPIILKNETLLFAQAFAAISHINFLNSNVYGSECLALKGQAIRKINEGLNNTDEARNDANIGAILCMALVSPFEVCFLSLPLHLSKTMDSNSLILLANARQHGNPKLLITSTDCTCQFVHQQLIINHRILVIKISTHTCSDYRKLLL